MVVAILEEVTEMSKPLYECSDQELRRAAHLQAVVYGVYTIFFACGVLGIAELLGAGISALIFTATAVAVGIVVGVSVAWYKLSTIPSQSMKDAMRMLADR